MYVNDVGEPFAMVMLNPSVVLPHELVAVTVYVAVAVKVVGVPVIKPVVVFKLNPAGKAGLTEYDVGEPPLLLGEFVAIAFPGQ